MDATVLVCTYNRDRLLAATIDSLAASRVPADIAWEVLVVDNNSTDRTREVVEGRAGGFPAPLRLLHEAQQGKSFALNSGIAAARGAIVAFTDDDVLVPAAWLEAGISPLLTRTDIDYTGGPVFPLWETRPPVWIHGDPGILWGPLALVDYGRDAFIFEQRRRIAMGVNMAVRRALIDRVGGFHPALERRGNSLMGQGQAEFFFRTRSVGVRGLYVPQMSLQHHVPAARMTKQYYRRWWYWKGVARGRMQALHPVSELGVDVSRAPHIANVPRFMWGSALGDGLGWVAAAAAGRAVRRAEREMMLAYFTGYAAERMSLTRGPRPNPESPAAQYLPDPSAAAGPGSPEAPRPR